MLKTTTFVIVCLNNSRLLTTKLLHEPSCSPQFYERSKLYRNIYILLCNCLLKHEKIVKYYD